MREHATPFKALRVLVRMEAGPTYDYTGRLTKTLLYTLVPELRLTHAVKGVLTPVTISPPFTPGKDGATELGEPAIPQYVRTTAEGGGSGWVLKPVNISGEYVLHIGAHARLADRIHEALQSLRTPLSIKVGENIVLYEIEEVTDATPEALEKASQVRPGSRVRVYLKSPAQIFNIYTPSKLPKFTPTAVEVLMTPYMLTNNILTIDANTLLKASATLGNLIETWYSLKTLKPVMIPFKGKREATLAGHVTYIIESRNEKTTNEIRKTLATAEIMGIGRSRQNGFGTTVIKPE